MKDNAITIFHGAPRPPIPMPFFVSAEEFPKLKIADNSIDSMHESHIEIQICHGYDGTLFVAGHLMLNWHGIPLVQEDFQVIPASLRKYHDPGQKP